MLVICSLPMPVGTPPSRRLFVLLTCCFSLYLSSPHFIVWLSRPKSERILTMCFWLFFSLSNDSLFSLTPRVVFPKSSSHTALICKRHSAYITASPSPAALKGANSKRHTSEERLEFFQFLKTQCEKIHLHVAY